MTSPTALHSTREGAVLVLSLDGPDTRNSIGPPIYDAVRSAVIEGGRDATVRAIMLTGRNDFFCSGGNLKNIRASAAQTMAEVSANTDKLNAMILAIRGCPKPVVAAVEGGAAGVGFSLALASDVIVASEGAKFVVAYVKVGLTPDGGVTHFLAEGLPRQLLSELCLTGAPIEAERLHSLGVVNDVVPAGEAFDAGLRLAGKLAAGATEAMGTIKATIAAAAHNDLATQLNLEAQGINQARFGPEAAEGVDAFFEKRRPNFARTRS